MRIKRIAAVTAGLMVAGGVFGTIAGMAVLMAWGLAEGDAIGLADLGPLLGLSLVLGGGLGAVLGPLSAWLLMRHVPLGVAVGGTTLGTLAGGVIGLIATADPFVAMSYGVAGFGISAIALRIRFPSRERRLLRS
jgi:hypothetical protein